MLEDFNWVKFFISFVLFAILPVWLLNFFEMSFIYKVGLTLVLGVITFVAVLTGGIKRGLVSR